MTNSYELEKYFNWNKTKRLTCQRFYTKNIKLIGIRKTLRKLELCLNYSMW